MLFWQQRMQRQRLCATNPFIGRELIKVHRLLDHVGDGVAGAQDMLTQVRRLVVYGSSTRLVFAPWQPTRWRLPQPPAADSASPPHPCPSCSCSPPTPSCC